MLSKLPWLYWLKTAIPACIGSELGQVSIKNFVKLHEFTKNHGRTGNGGEIMKITGNFGKSRKR